MASICSVRAWTMSELYLKGTEALQIYRRWLRAPSHMMQAFFPISQLIHGATVLGLDEAGDLPRETRDPPLTSTMRLVSRSQAGQGRERLTLRLEQPKPCWGVMNVTGHVAAWSFTADEAPAASLQVTFSPRSLLLYQTRYTL